MILMQKEAYAVKFHRLSGKPERALAGNSVDQASAQRARRFYMAPAVYAYFYLLGERGEELPGPYFCSGTGWFSIEGWLAVSGSPIHFRKLLVNAPMEDGMVGISTKSLFNPDSRTGTPGWKSRSIIN